MYATSPSRLIPKGTILHTAGDVYQSAYRVVRGCLKSYVIDRAGKEHILQFAPEEWFISDMDSFYNQSPSLVYIEAIEETEVIVFKKNIIGTTESDNKEVLIELNKKLRNNVIASNRRLIAMLSATAVERYTEFTEIYPMLVQRLPLKLIASYIGITPEYLSEIRRKIVRK